MTETKTFDPRIVLDGARIVAVRLDDDLVAQVVAGDWCDVPVGEDVRESVPALIGLEDELAQDLPYLHLPFVTLGDSHETPAAISVQRDWKSGALWLLLRDVSEEAAIQERLVHQHNALSLAQRELSKARDAALAADKAKTRFLANVSHELRTPLNVVIGGASILLKPRKTALPAEDLHAFVRDIHDSGTLLLQLVDDLIDLSRAETGNLALVEEWSHTGVIVEGMVRLAKALPGAEGIEIVQSGDRVELYADPRRVKQILLNLISNAVKACKPGNRIEIATEQREDGCLVLSVCDNGPGMSKAELTIALEPFGQPKAHDAESGTGLGLPIVARLAELHQARFDIATAPGSGLKASVEFPASRLPAAAR